MPEAHSHNKSRDGLGLGSSILKNAHDCTGRFRLKNTNLDNSEYDYFLFTTNNMAGVIASLGQDQDISGCSCSALVVALEAIRVPANERGFRSFNSSGFHTEYSKTRTKYLFSNKHDLWNRKTVFHNLSFLKSSNQRSFWMSIPVAFKCPKAPVPYP